MTDKPSEWAMNVFQAAMAEYAKPGDDFRERAALIIDQARKKWEAEICRWLRTEAVAALGLVLDMAAASIENGEHLKSGAATPPASDTDASGTGQPFTHKTSVRGSEGA